MKLRFQKATISHNVGYLREEIPEKRPPQKDDYRNNFRELIKGEPFKTDTWGKKVPKVTSVPHFFIMENYEVWCLLSKWLINIVLRGP